ncbi:MAG: hypothetical protein R3F37_23475 [Candidatus Competibacteraceae bacterium]
MKHPTKPFSTAGTFALLPLALSLTAFSAGVTPNPAVRAVFAKSRR